MTTLEIVEILVRIAWLGARGRLRHRACPDELAGHGPRRQPACRPAGMTVAIVATAVLILTRGAGTATASAPSCWGIILLGIVLGGGLGLYTARTVKMTAMPQLVSLFNAVGGGAAALIAIDDYLRLAGIGAPIRLDHNIFIVLDIIIGSITFTGSIVASGKLQGLIPGKPIIVPGGQLVTLALAGITVIAALFLFITGNAEPRADARHPRRGADLRRDHDAAHRRRRHAGRHLAAQLVHRHGRGDGRLRDRQPGADHRRRPRRRLGRDPDEAHGRRHEPVGPEHHDRRVRWRRRRGGCRGRGRAARSAPSARTTSRSSWPTPST